MDGYNTSKINYLVKHWPRATVAVSSWLKKMGISQQLTYRYEQSGWLESIGHGAFKWQDDSISWQGALVALQQQMNLKIYCAAKSALEELGEAHFLQMGQGAT